MAFVRQIARMVTVLHFGRPFAQGTIDEIIAHEEFRRPTSARRRMSNKSLLDFAGLYAGYGSTQFCRGIDLTIGPGEIVGVIGRKGSAR
jgi:ABC-type branched-subunit amino acid transport system ATPase component